MFGGESLKILDRALSSDPSRVVEGDSFNNIAVKIEITVFL